MHTKNAKKRLFICSASHSTRLYQMGVNSERFLLCLSRLYSTIGITFAFRTEFPLQRSPQNFHLLIHFVA